MENSKHSFVHEEAGSLPAKAGCGEEILNFIYSPLWPESNQRQAGSL